MSTPTVAVIHGVGNRDQAAFESAVAVLAERIGVPANLVPVFWGDIGAASDGLDAVIPHSGVRAESVAPDRGLGLALLNNGGATTRAAAAAAIAVADGFSSSAGEQVRSAEVDDMRTEIIATWPDLPNLREVTDERALREIGESVAIAVGVGDDGRASSPTGTEEVRVSLDPRRAVRQALAAIDRSLGAVIGAVGGSLNAYVRTAAAPGLGTFVGDVLVYQRHQREIQARVWSTLEAAGSRLGTPERPVCVLAHSLGGVIAVDMATASNAPLCISRLLTFGSQSPLFHIMDPRGGALAPYTGTPSPLPTTIGRWVNLWEPMDPLAFLAGRIWVLASGLPPEDRATRHLASYGLWTHSSYWTAADLAEAARELLTSSLPP